jgi:hypothetical protein
MDMPARLLLTREAAMSQANSLRISRESKVCRASRVTEVGGIGQRFRPKEHPVLILG